MAAHHPVGRPRITEAERLTDVGQHMPVFKPGKANNRDYKVCSHTMREMRKREHGGERVGHIKRSNYCCMKCDVFLCISEMTEQGHSINNCFYVWHHNVEYWWA
ncbi:hypothetical protein LSAT2_024905 [Lamellibrachia satsuma]|nr:hypothetical protein LSAT2_024905 [Lamellibrachia satsuma]